MEKGTTFLNARKLILGVKRFFWAKLKLSETDRINVATLVCSDRKQATKTRDAIAKWFSSMELHSIHMHVSGWKLDNATVRIFCIAYPDGPTDYLECNVHIDQNVMSLLHLNMEKKGPIKLSYGWIEGSGANQKLYFVDRSGFDHQDELATIYFCLYRPNSSQIPKTLES